MKRTGFATRQRVAMKRTGRLRPKRAKPSRRSASSREWGTVSGFLAAADRAIAVLDEMRMALLALNASVRLGRKR